MPEQYIGLFPPLRGTEGFPSFLASFLQVLKSENKGIGLDSQLQGPFQRLIAKLYPQAISAGCGKGTIELVLFEPSFFKLFLEQNTQKIGLILVGFSPVLGDMLEAKRFMGQCVRSGISESRLRPVLFRSPVKNSLSLDVIENELGRIDIEIPLDPSLMMRLENHQALLQDEASNSKPMKAIEALARKSLMWMKEESFKKAPRLNVSHIENEAYANVTTILNQEPLSSATSPKEVTELIERELERILIEHQPLSCSQKDTGQIIQKVRDRILGFGPLEDLLRDPSINEIMVNGPRDIYIEKSGMVKKSTVRFLDEPQFQMVVDRLIQESGRRVDFSSPLCDFRLKDGSRANIVIPPVSLQGPVVTIRRFHPQVSSLEALVQNGTLREADQLLLAGLIEQRKNILIAGNSGCGKTTLLNILSSYINAQDRIVTLEDTAELKLSQPHVVRFETRKENAEGEGEVSLADLVVNALRMRPDRLVVGECRGPEVVPMIQAMNTGHKGCLTTVHANSAEDVLPRIESLLLMAASHWPISVVRSQIGSALDVVVYLERIGTKRTLKEVMAVDYKNNQFVLENLRK